MRSNKPTLPALVKAGKTQEDAYWANIDCATEKDCVEVLGLVYDCDPLVRRAAILTVPLIFTEISELLLEKMIKLTRDKDPSVRDAACFVLAEQWRDVDSLELREALFMRLEDPDFDVRSEATVGLAYRGDNRVREYVIGALNGMYGPVTKLDMIAAGALGDENLHELVRQASLGWVDDGESPTLVELVERLTRPNGPGEDLFEGVAQIYRERAENASSAGSLHWWKMMSAMLEISPTRAPEFLDLVDIQIGDDAPARILLREDSALAQMADKIRRPEHSGE